MSIQKCLQRAQFVIEIPASNDVGEWVSSLHALQAIRAFCLFVVDYLLTDSARMRFVCFSLHRLDEKKLDLIFFKEINEFLESNKLNFTVMHSQFPFRFRYDL